MAVAVAMATAVAVAVAVAVAAALAVALAVALALALWLKHVKVSPISWLIFTYQLKSFSSHSLGRVPCHIVDEDILD